MFLYWMTFHFLVHVECVVELHTHHHHTQETKSDFESSFTSPNNKNNEPVPSSGEGVPNSWLYRFPPWSTPDNPPPPSFNSTPRGSLRAKETSFLARVLTPPNSEVKNDFLDDASLSRHFPFQGNRNIENENFKRHIPSGGSNRDATFGSSSIFQQDRDIAHLAFNTDEAITLDLAGNRGREAERVVLIPPNSHRGSPTTDFSLDERHPGLRGRFQNDHILALAPNSDPTLIAFDEVNTQNIPVRNANFEVTGRDFFREPRLHETFRPINSPFPIRAQRNVLDLPVGLIPPGNIVQVPKYPPLPLEDHDYLSKAFSSQRNTEGDQIIDLQQQDELTDTRKLRLQSNSDFLTPQPQVLFPNAGEESIPERRGNKRSPRLVAHNNFPLSVPVQRLPKVSPRGLNPLATHTGTTDSVHPSSIQDIIESQEITSNFRRNRRKRRKPGIKLPDFGFWVWPRN